MNKHTMIGLDLAKSVFHLVDNQGKRKMLRRSQVMPFFANHQQSIVAMEACASAHYWARELKALGHEVRLLPPQHVKGYLRGQKNDFNDAKAILEASQHNCIRQVPVKSIEQQGDQALLRSRQQLIKERTALANHVRALLLEHGFAIAQGLHVLKKRLPDIMTQDRKDISPLVHRILERQYQKLRGLDDEVAWYDIQIKEQSKRLEDCQRLQGVPGFGPVVSFAFKAWLGSGQQFKRGRDASAALGLVPKQHSSGGKNQLFGITKKGDSYLRGLVIHGARSVVRLAATRTDRLSLWVTNLIAKRGKNKAIVALANKLIRMAWVVVARQEEYCLIEA